MSRLHAILDLVSLYSKPPFNKRWLVGIKMAAYGTFHLRLFFFTVLLFSQVRSVSPSKERRNVLPSIEWIHRKSLEQLFLPAFHWFEAPRPRCVARLIISDCTAGLSQMWILYSSDHKLYTFISSHSPQQCKCHVAGWGGGGRGEEGESHWVWCGGGGAVSGKMHHASVSPHCWHHKYLQLLH